MISEDLTRRQGWTKTMIFKRKKIDPSQDGGTEFDNHSGYSWVILGGLGIFITFGLYVSQIVTSETFMLRSMGLPPIETVFVLLQPFDMMFGRIRDEALIAAGTGWGLQFFHTILAFNVTKPLLALKRSASGMREWHTESLRSGYSSWRAKTFLVALILIVGFNLYADFTYQSRSTFVASIYTLLTVTATTFGAPYCIQLVRAGFTIIREDHETAKSLSLARRERRPQWTKARPVLEVAPAEQRQTTQKPSTPNQSRAAQAFHSAQTHLLDN
jgi:hypothetical protein